MVLPRLGMLFAAGLTLSACAEGFDGLSASSGSGFSTTTSEYYATPAYPAQGYYPQPGIVTPYPYQPGYIAVPYGYQEEERFHRRERDWHEYRERNPEYRREGRQNFEQPRQNFEQPRRDDQRGPQMLVQPHGPPPQAAPPPPASTPQVRQNQQLLDQLGFRPNR